MNEGINAVNELYSFLLTPSTRPYLYTWPFSYLTTSSARMNVKTTFSSDFILFVNSHPNVTFADPMNPNMSLRTLSQVLQINHIHKMFVAK